MNRLLLSMLMALIFGCGGDDGPASPPADPASPPGVENKPYGLWSAPNVQLRIEANGQWLANVAQVNCGGGRIAPAWSRSGLVESLDGDIIGLFESDYTACSSCSRDWILNVKYVKDADSMRITAGYRFCGCQAACTTGGVATRVQ